MEQEQTKQPSKEEVIKFLTDKLEVRRLQAELIQLDSNMAVADYNRIVAVLKVRELTEQEPQDDNGEEVDLTSKVNHKDGKLVNKKIINADFSKAKSETK